MKTILYAAGSKPGSYFRTQWKNGELLPDDIEVIAYGNSDAERSTKKTGMSRNGKPIISPKEIADFDYDQVMICTNGFRGDVYKILIQNSVPVEKISFLFCREKLLHDWGMEFRCLPDGTFETRYGAAVIREKNSCDLSVVIGGIVGNEYNMSVLPRTVVIDMGMNIGFSVLLFAQNPNVSKVYGFEPFPSTYQEALDNIALNEQWIRDKIVTENIAISDRDALENVSFPENDSAGWSIVDGGSGARSASIRLRNVKDVVRSIVEENDGQHFLLKVNIEGSEYEVFEALAETDLLNKIGAISVHCHYKGPKPLLEIFDRFGFQYMIQGNSKFCMIYAFR